MNINERGYLTVKKLTSFQVADMEIIYWSVRSSGRRGGDRIKVWDGVKGWMVGIVILASYKFYFMRVDDDLV